MAYMDDKEKVNKLAEENASMHFNKQYSPDQHWACVCSFIKGFYTCKDLIINQQKNETQNNHTP